MAGNATTPGRSVTSRALAILGAFDGRHRLLGLTELANRAGLPVPTAHRLVGELVSWGALSRTDSGEYVVGRRLWDIGLLAPVHTGLQQITSPYLHDLHDLHDLYGATLATVHLAVRDDLQALYVDRLSGHASVPVVSAIGSRLPLHATGVGKVLLAHAPADVQDEVLSDLPRITPYTVSRPGLLRGRLKKVREDDYATTVEEMSLGACTVAVPIRSDGAVVALGLVVPSLKRNRARLVSALQVAARGIGRRLMGPVAG
ncbi:IclR family transcriptional regulator [Streptomyces pratens]|uniref:IclR family transcriptional regulator n=1 Tax=Streptomyces pratens TaxID=887456 RepID=A0ABW1LSJ9_9ACTN